MVNLNNKRLLVYNSARSFDESTRTRISLEYHRTERLSAFAAGIIDEPGTKGGVGVVPGTFFIFLRGADRVYCGAGRT